MFRRAQNHQKMVNRDYQKTIKTPIIVVNEHFLIFLFCLAIKLINAVRLDNHKNNDTYVM